MTVALVLGRTVALVLVPTYPAALKFRVRLPSESEPRVYWPEVFVVLAALVSNVPIKLGTAVMVLYFRNPVEIAGALASIGELMEGRELSIALGQGQPVTPTLIRVVKPIRALRETAQCLTHLLHGETVTIRNVSGGAVCSQPIPGMQMSGRCTSANRFQGDGFQKK